MTLKDAALCSAGSMNLISRTFYAVDGMLRNISFGLLLLAQTHFLWLHSNFKVMQFSAFLGCCFWGFSMLGTVCKGNWGWPDCFLEIKLVIINLVSPHFFSHEKYSYSLICHRYHIMNNHNTSQKLPKLGYERLGIEKKIFIFFLINSPFFKLHVYMYEILKEFNINKQIKLFFQNILSNSTWETNLNLNCLRETHVAEVLVFTWLPVLGEKAKVKALTHHCQKIQW